MHPPNYNCIVYGILGYHFMPKTYITVTAPIRLTLFLHSCFLLVCFIFRGPWQILESVFIINLVVLQL